MRALRDIEGILSAMKNLSLVELTKIARFTVTQQELLCSVEETLADFQQFHGAPWIASEESALVMFSSGPSADFAGDSTKRLRRRSIASRPPRRLPS